MRIVWTAFLHFAVSQSVADPGICKGGEEQTTVEGEHQKNPQEIKKILVRNTGRDAIWEFGLEYDGKVH